MSNYTEYRFKKPKRADFRFDGGRYWIWKVELLVWWDGEYSHDTMHYVKDYETDEEVDVPYPDTDPRWEKWMQLVEEKGNWFLPLQNFSYEW